MLISICLVIGVLALAITLEVLMLGLGPYTRE